MKLDTVSRGIHILMGGVLIIFLGYLLTSSVNSRGVIRFIAYTMTFLFPLTIVVLLFGIYRCGYPFIVTFVAGLLATICIVWCIQDVLVFDVPLGLKSDYLLFWYTVSLLAAFYIMLLKRGSIIRWLRKWDPWE